MNVGQSAGTDVRLPLESVRNRQGAIHAISSGWTGLERKAAAYRTLLEHVAGRPPGRGPRGGAARRGGRGVGASRRPRPAGSSSISIGQAGAREAGAGVNAAARRPPASPPGGRAHPARRDALPRRHRPARSGSRRVRAQPVRARAHRRHEVPDGLEGVVAVITAADLEGRRGRPAGAGLRGRRGLGRGPSGAGRATRCATPGQPVAAVLAESRALAEDAAELVEVDYEPLDAGARRARLRA